MASEVLPSLVSRARKAIWNRHPSRSHKRQKSKNQKTVSKRCFL